jgi:O-antigen/teichoic acid export membrane protein
LIDLPYTKHKKNFVSLLGGQSISFAINFFSILLAARYLGVEQFGEFANLLAIITILSKFIDFGIGPILFRELSKDPSKGELFNATLTIKIILSGIIFIGMNIAFILLSFTKVEFFLSNMLFLTIFISSRMANFREILSTPFKAKMDMQFPMLLNVLDNLLLLIGVFIMPYLNLGIIYFTTIYLLSNLPGFIFILILLHKNFSIKFKFVLMNFMWLVKESVPLAGFVIFTVIFQQIDTIIIKYSKTAFDAGIFSAAIRLTNPLNIIPSTIVTAFFPFIVNKEIQKSKKDFVIKLLYKLLFLTSLIIAVVSSFKIHDFTVLIFGQNYYQASYPALLLFWSQIFLFFNFFSLDLLTANNLQKWNFIYAFTIVIINICLDIILIPLYSFTGASIAKLVASIVGTTFLSFILVKAGINFKCINIPVLGFISSVIGLFYLISLLPLYIYLLVGIPVFILLLFVFRLFDVEELKTILMFINKEKWIKIFLKT